MSKWYDVSLPVFKKGDDMHSCLEEAKGNTVEAFKLAAVQYRAAADHCTRLAAIAEKNPEFKITQADTHVITVEGPDALLSVLEKEHLLFCLDEGDDEDFEDSEDMPPEDEEDEEFSDMELAGHPEKPNGG